jgi:hypothetical protein
VANPHGGKHKFCAFNSTRSVKVKCHFRFEFGISHLALSNPAHNLQPLFVNIKKRNLADFQVTFVLDKAIN